MTSTIRTILMLLLMLPATAGLLAQERSTETTTTSETATAAKAAPASDTEVDAVPDDLRRTSHETRVRFITLLQRYPTELGTILALDPTLLSNEGFLTGYPELAKFVADHPEVRRNPRFFLAEYEPMPHRPRSQFSEMLEGLFIFAMMCFWAFVLAWIIRAVIEQRRWSRLSKAQSEVHNKILDRFSTSEELMQYIRTPAGTKFLESAPIPLHAEQAPQNAPLNRVLWSIQLGVVVAAGAIGMLIVSTSLEKEAAEGFFAMGSIALCIGIGFVISALVSLFLSKRLGLWQGTGSSRADALVDDSVVVK